MDRARFHQGTFRSLTVAQRRALIRALREEVTHTADRGRLLTVTRRWLYDHKLLVARDRDLRAVIVAARRQYETTLAKTIHADVGEELLER
jgi:hypothetical protein